MTSASAAHGLFCTPLLAHHPHAASAIIWVLVLAITAPQFLYSFIWVRPKIWQSLFRKQSVEVFVFLGLMGKVLQAQAVAFWFWNNRPTGLCGPWRSISLAAWVGAVLLITLGQTLNASIFRTIGAHGVYYGSKLGKKVPYVNGWPFSLCAHPQYTGSVLTIWGGALLLHSQLPAGAAQAAVVALAVYWTVMYIVMGSVEHFF